MTGYKGIYVLAMICIILSQMVTIVSPLIIRTTIDSIIGSEPIGSNFLERLIQYIGGRAYLRKKSLDYWCTISIYCNFKRYIALF